ncbi:calcium-binding protein [Lysobacteraceae bacterium NML08-0793]|nr:calcium-binding protein [Xanthomonadaceae bacterium NML08-0793]
MSTLSHELLSQLPAGAVQQIAGQLGVDPNQAQSAIGAALPLLLGALGKNASQPQGAEALLGALNRDHAASGGIGELLGSVLGGNSPQGNGAGILGHIFGGNTGKVAQGLGQTTGLGSDKADMLMKILAPIVMAWLAKRMLGGGQATDANALGAALGADAKAAQQSGLGGLLGSVLDQDGDGQLGLSDLMKVGGSLLGGKH